MAEANRRKGEQVVRKLKNHPLALGALGLLVTVGMATALAAVNSSTEPGSTYGYLKLFNEVLALVRHNYVEVVPENTLMKGAYEGLLAALDGESEYLTSAQYQMLMSSAADPEATSGIFLTRRGGFLFVAAVLPGSDAEAHGVRPGDRIRSISTRTSRDISFTEAQRLLQGKPGTSVKLELARAEEPGRLKLTLEKREVELPGPALLPAQDSEDVAVVRIPSFRKGTRKELERIFRRLHQSQTRRAVLDLRGNAWGDPQEAVAAASLLSGEGTQAILRMRDGPEEPIQGKGPRTPWEGDLLLLTDAGTALAAEIFVAALEDRGVATHAGERTLGRAGEREAIPLANGDYLLLTVRKYVSPSGKTWHGEGLVPAVSIPANPDVPFEERAGKQLERAMEWLREPKAADKAA